MNVGDQVWIYELPWQPERITCPVCKGRLFLAIGDEEIACDYCKGEPNVQDQWHFELIVRQVYIERMVSTSDGHHIDTEYHIEGGRRLNQWFLTEEEARRAGQERKIVLEAEEARRCIERVRGYKKSATWLLGYHKRELKEHLREVEYHKKQLGLT